MTWPRLAIRMLEESVPKGCKTSRMMECEKLQLYLHILVLDGGEKLGWGVGLGKGVGKERGSTGSLEPSMRITRGEVRQTVVTG